jgi:hypothetical protein
LPNVHQIELIVGWRHSGGRLTVFLSTPTADTSRGFIVVAFPTIKLKDRHIIVVSGFRIATDASGRTDELVVIHETALKAVAAANKKAVAFGFVNGTWFPAA